MKNFDIHELQEAAHEVAAQRHPDQAAGWDRWAFRSRNWAEIRTTGGIVLVTREEAEQMAARLREDR
ncbi:MAG TPA: hypothetical protein VFD49_09080 [Candidatus Dormibacteraeota bacterium]|nr:hypothetical protein [Candidatus Dormibacteraeota bacterium]